MVFYREQAFEEISLLEKPKQNFLGPPKVLLFLALLGPVGYFAWMVWSVKNLPPPLPSFSERIIGKWEATDGSGWNIEFTPGEAAISQGKTVMVRGNYQFLGDGELELNNLRVGKEVQFEPWQINQGRITKEITIVGMSTRRRSSEESLSLYREISQRQNIRPSHAHTPRRSRRVAHAQNPFIPNAALPFAAATSSCKIVEVRTGGTLRYLRRSNKTTADRIYATNDDY